MSLTTNCRPFTDPGAICGTTSAADHDGAPGARWGELHDPAHALDGRVVVDDEAEPIGVEVLARSRSETGTTITSKVQFMHSTLPASIRSLLVQSAPCLRDRLPSLTISPGSSGSTLRAR